jgi:hypothetical protein
MSTTDTVIATGFSDTLTLLERIDKAIQLQGDGGVSNSTIEATGTFNKIVRATLLANTVATSQGVMVGLDDATRECIAEISKAVRGCRRLNRHYTDQDFPMEHDWTNGGNDCLTSLDGSGAELQPGCVQRIQEIFDHLQFFMFDDTTVGDTLVSVEVYRYLMAVLAALYVTSPLVHRISSARDEQVDVYGFCFFRDKTPPQTRSSATPFVQNAYAGG